MISVQGLSKQFNKKVIFENVTMVFEPNKSYALVGQSGSGKSTLLNAIGRLEKPTCGTIMLDNQNIWDIKEKTF